ncbi:protein TolQ [Geminicoccaceae bacterium 1502E]|nr:protein TolQ [Geminicoccaceae bacterium 1502E]
MDQGAINALELGAAGAGPSLWALFLQADLVVKSVMLLLLVASLWCWAVIFDKVVRLTRLRRKAVVFERAFWSGAPLDELYRRLVKRADHPMALMFATAMDEWREAPRTTDPLAQSNIVGRIGRVMQLTLEREVQSLERHLPSLGTIGSTAPFVGLFGTVWGIMNSFQSIAISKNTTLAVVAPGIAEALFATALGLAAAIPAVIAFNKLSTDLDSYADRLSSFADEFTVVVSRELEAAKAA